MAKMLQFRRGATTLSLLAGAGAGLRCMKWYPKAADLVYRDIPPYVIETMSILVDRTSDDNLALSMQALDDMRLFASMYWHDPLVQDPVWFQTRMENEDTGYSTWALVRRILIEWRSEKTAPVEEPACSMVRLNVEIERHPFWENPAAYAKHPQTGLSGATVLYDYTATGAGGTGDIRGDVAARCWRFALAPNAAGHDLDRVWCGFRSASKYGDTPADFTPIWECEDTGATAGTDCSAPTTDTTASPGGAGNTKRTVSFATPGWAKRLTIDVEAAVTGGNIDEAIGHFLWLFRAKVGSATTCEVQFRFGYQALADADFIRGPIVEITNTNWDFFEMGEASIPLVGMQAYVQGRWNMLRHWTLQIWVRRTAGADILHMDCTCPIPLDEGWLVAKNIGAVDTGDVFEYSQSARDISKAWVKDGSGNIQAYPEFSDGSFRFPPGDGRMVIAYAELDRSVLSNAFDVIATFAIPRWLNLRGAV